VSVVVWTPQSIGREWVHLGEAQSWPDRAFSFPSSSVAIKPPFAVHLIQARNLTGWKGMTRYPGRALFSPTLKQKLGAALWVIDRAPQTLRHRTTPSAISDAESEWRRTSSVACDDPGLLQSLCCKNGEQ